MEILTALLSINCTAFVILEYRVSFIELLGISSGLASVYWAAKMNPLTWPVGLVNTAAFFTIFYQVQLYSEMLLQVFFAVVTVYGWQQWRDTQTSKGTVLKNFSPKRLCLCIAGVAAGTVLLGLLTSRVHHWLPSIFSVPAASPFQDAFTTAASIAATFLLARRAVETWILWIAVDVVSVQLYAARSIPFMSLLYLVLLVMAARGLVSWWRILNYAPGPSIR